MVLKMFSWSMKINDLKFEFNEDINWCDRFIETTCLRIQLSHDDKTL